MDDSILHLRIWVVIVVIASVLFCWTLYSLLRRIPPEDQQFPSWFVWLFLIPYVGFIFQWIMLPWGIPNALKKHFATNQDAIADADILFKLGLAQFVVMLFSLIFQHALGFYLGWLGIALWIVYWLLIIRFKTRYFK